MNNDTVEEIVPLKLYKYYSSNGIEKVLFDNTLRWNLPCEENDPFEVLARCWDTEAAKEKAQGLRQEDMIFLEGIFDEKSVQEKVSHVTAFVSFSKYNNSILMWAHYAGNHTGACLEFDATKLQGFNVPQYVAYADPGEDRAEFPLPHENKQEDSSEYQNRARDFLCKKASEWTYEHECRWIAHPMSKYIGCKKEGDKFILISDIPSGAITKLIFGCNVPISTRLAWAKRVRIRHPKCVFAEVVPDPKKYVLNIENLFMDEIETASSSPPET